MRGCRSASSAGGGRTGVEYVLFEGRLGCTSSRAAGAPDAAWPEYRETCTRGSRAIADVWRIVTPQGLRSGGGRRGQARATPSITCAAARLRRLTANERIDLDPATVSRVMCQTLEGKPGPLSDSTRYAVTDVAPETKRLLLRLLTPADAAALHRCTGDPSVMRYWYPGPDADVAATGGPRRRDRVALARAQLR